MPTDIGKYNVKIVHYSSSGQSKKYNNTIHINSSSYIDEHQDVVWFNNNQYKLIFGKPRAIDSHNKLLAVVKINHGKKVIRRRYMCDMSNVPLTNDELGLTSESTRILFDNTPASGELVSVEKGDWFDSILYYWNHPFHATRISFKIGLPALL
jgi:hypothetical protein